MSDQEPTRPGQDDAALAPELARLDALLLAEGQRWRRTEPSTAGLERHVRALVQAGGPGLRSEDSMLTNRTMPDDRPTPRPLPTRPPSRWRGPLALVATIMLVALAASVFAVLKNGGTGAHPTGKHATPTPALVRLPAPLPKDVNLPLTRNEYLQGISFSSALDGWAVGGVIVPQQANAAPVTTHAVLIHYHNGVWSSPADSFPTISLDDVSMLSQSDGWAVGQVDDTSTTTVQTDYYTGAVLLHFTGSHWRVVSTPALATLHPNTIHMFNPDAGYVTGVVNVPSATAKGSVEQHVALAVYQNGAWTLITTPFSFPNSQVVMVSPSEGWASVLKNLTPAAGGMPNPQTTVYHYRSGVWTPDHTFEGWGVSISAQSPYDVWLMASQCDNCTGQMQRVETEGRIEQYNGATWTRIKPLSQADFSRIRTAGPCDLIQRWIADDGASGVWAVYVCRDTGQPVSASAYVTAMWIHTVDGWRLTPQPASGGAVVALVADHSGGTWAIEQSASGAPQTTTILYSLDVLKNGWMVYGHN